MATFFSDLKSTLPLELLLEVQALDGLWIAVQNPVVPRAATIAELHADWPVLLNPLFPTTEEDLSRLRDRANAWTGFGFNVQGAIPRAALFFADGVEGVLDYFPEWVRGLNPESVGQVRFKAIPPRRRSSGSALAGRSVSVADPITPGAPIEWTGTTDDGATSSSNGTLAAFLDDGAGGIWMMSANHVMSVNNACSVNEVSVNGRVVSRQTTAVMISDTPSVNMADVAIALWDSDAPNPQIPDLPPLVKKPVPAAAAKGLVVTKVTSGRTTTGLVAYVAEKIKAEPFEPFSQAQFADQILVRTQGAAFSGEGDSGSLVVYTEGDSTMPVGLLVFNSAVAEEEPKPLFSVVTPYENLIQALAATTGKTFTLLTADGNSSRTGLAVQPERPRAQLRHNLKLNAHEVAGK